MDISTVEQFVLNEFNNEIPKGIALAIDNEVIPRESWKQHPLSEGNKIIIIKATQGG